MAIATEPEGLYEVIGDQVVETPPIGAYECWLANVLAKRLILWVDPQNS